MSDAENYDELAERLTGEAPVKGKGETLRGEAAAASGQQLLTTALGLEHLSKEDVTKLFNNSEFVKWVCYPDSQLSEELLDLLSNEPSTLLYGGGGSGKTAIPANSSHDANEE